MDRETAETDRLGTAIYRCVACLRPERQTGPMKRLGPNRDHHLCDDCNPEVETA